MKVMTNTELINELLADYPGDASVWRDSQEKKHGGVRIISKPNKSLKEWLRQVNATLTRQFSEWPNYIHGGRINHSYITFIRPHVGRTMVITIDIHDCFPSITSKMIAASLEKHLGIDNLTSEKLAIKICDKGRLAQGFPTSSFVCNLILLDCLYELNKLMEKADVTMTNYVDDIALSGDIVEPHMVINEVILALSKVGLSVKKAKILVMPSNRRQLILGLQVNTRLTLTKSKKKDLIRGVISGAMTERSARGWIANTKAFDSNFSDKLESLLEARLSKI